MADYIALIMAAAALFTALGTVWYNWRKSRTEATEAKTEATGATTDEGRAIVDAFDRLTTKLQAEIDRLRARVTELESRQITWEIERAALLGRINALETENRALRREMDTLKKGAEDRHLQ